MLSAALWFLVLQLISVPARGATFIVFRYDDFSADVFAVSGNESLSTRIWEAEQEVDRLFQKFAMKYVVAIIPETERDEYAGQEHAGGESHFEATGFTEKNEKIEFIRKCVRAGRIEVAQHGYRHINYAGKNQIAGEFKHRRFDSQLRDIELGKKALCETYGIEVITTFVPPFNGWDKDTAKALKEAGFSVLSADSRYWHNDACALKLIPYTAQLWELEELISMGKVPDDAFIIVLYHPTQIAKLPGKEQLYFGPERLERLLAHLDANESIRVVTLSELASAEGGFNNDLYRQAYRLKGLQRLWKGILPARLQPDGWRLPFLRKGGHLGVIRRWETISAASAIGVIFLGSMVRFLLHFIIPGRWCKRLDIAGIPVLLVSIASEIELMSRGFLPTGIRLLPAFLALSFAVSFVLSTLWEHFPVAALAKPKQPK